VKTNRSRSWSLSHYKQSSGAAVTLMKTKSSGTGAMFMKEELRSRSCDIFTTAPRSWKNSNCSRAHRRSRV